MTTLRYSETQECSLNPDFWRLLNPDGSFMMNHYRSRISRQEFIDWYQLNQDAVFVGVTDGRLDGLQIQLSQSEFRRIADRTYEGFQFWRLSA